LGVLKPDNLTSKKGRNLKGEKFGRPAVTHFKPLRGRKAGGLDFWTAGMPDAEHSETSGGQQSERRNVGMAGPLDFQNLDVPKCLNAGPPDVRNFKRLDVVKARP
jgi:hypothetical protein